MSIDRSPRWHLKAAHIESFGKLSEESLVGFGPGMNVVFGSNESGKSTWASFIAGVLFGWPDGRSHSNTYKPRNAERSGRLVFESMVGEQTTLARTRNADGVQDEHGLLADIDEASFQTVFALDSDELLALDNTVELTSHLLTAGSGTAVSPAKALSEIDRRIAAKFSRAASEPDSIARLTARLAELDAELAQAEEQTKALMGQSREYAELAPKRAELAARHEELNAYIEGRTADLSLLQKLIEQVGMLEEQREELLAELAHLRSEQDGQGFGDGASSSGFSDVATDEATATASMRATSAMDELVGLDASEERIIRDSLDDLQAVHEHLASEVDFARRDCERSQASYGLLLEQAARDRSQERRHRRLGQIALSVILPLACLFIGVPTTLYGRSIGSLTVMAFGVVLVAAALMMGVAALMLLRPPEQAENREDRLADAEWALRQDQKKLAERERELAEHDEQIASYLRFNHLEEADGSLRRARSLLDEAHEARASRELSQQRRQNLEQQVVGVDHALERARGQRDGLLEDAKVADLAAFERLVAQAIEKRKELIARAEEADTRYGELATRLEQARDAQDFQRLKQERSAIRTRLAESRGEYACLLLARRNLAMAIERWEEKSQPEVYRIAGELLSEMTQGAWKRVRLGANGSVQVVSASGEPRNPELLSLGTRQQLYLCLRIALLLTAHQVGRAMPVLADDILVNFDAERRRVAATVLLRLSQQRQVLIFTCHEEVRDLLCGLEAPVTLIELQ